MNLRRPCNTCKRRLPFKYSVGSRLRAIASYTYLISCRSIVFLRAPALRINSVLVRVGFLNRSRSAPNPRRALLIFDCSAEGGVSSRLFGFVGWVSARRRPRPSWATWRARRRRLNQIFGIRQLGLIFLASGRSKRLDCNSIGRSRVVFIGCGRGE